MPLSSLLLMAAMTPSMTAEQLLERIDADYWDAATGLYAESWEKGVRSQQPAFNWSVGVMISALNAMSPGSDLARKRLPVYLEGVLRYWNDLGPVPGFDVLPAPKPVDRYYDDNAWMVMALFESADVLKDKEWEKWGLKALDYALSGESERLGGGIYWRESDKASKNTCSNSPVAAAALEAYERTGEVKYREAGLRLLDWTLKNLQDPTDGLMWDNVNLEGQVEKTKWSYNTALTVKAVLQAEKLGRTFSVSGKDLFGRAWKHWYDPAVGFECEGRFAHLLVDVGVEFGLLSREQLAQAQASVLKLASNGRFGSRWDRTSDRERFEMIDQVSVLRILAL